MQVSFPKKVYFLLATLFLAIEFVVFSFMPQGLGISSPQIDTLLYCQSARQIALGQPFVFTPLGDISTGNTTYLYPFLLVPYYLIWGHGYGVFLYGFLLNGILYLWFVWSWLQILDQLIVDNWAKNLGACLLITYGQLIAVASGQTDTGLFMAVSAAIFSAILREKWTVFGFLLVLSPWCRPEGTILIFLFPMALVFARCFLNRPIRRMEWLISIVALVSAFSVFGVNYLLTDQFQYQSVALKGYFKEFGFLSGAFATMVDLFRMVPEQVFGTSANVPRMFLGIPVLSGILILIGFSFFDWGRSREKQWKLLWWIAACMASLLLVASSGWQGTNLDRYEGWVFPLIPLFTAVGIRSLSRFKKNVCRTVAVLFIGLQFASLMCVYFPILADNSVLVWSKVEQFEDLARKMPADASFGTSSELNYAFVHAEVHPKGKFVIQNFAGIYSPLFLERNRLLNLEKVKHCSVPRFDYWILSSDQLSLHQQGDIECLSGKQVAQSFNQTQIRETDWKAMERALEIPFDTNSWNLVDTLDVGYPHDELVHGYETFTRFSGYDFIPFAGCLTNITTLLPLFDVGRPIIGSDSMTISTNPRKLLRVFLRTVSEANFPFKFVPGSSGTKLFSIASPMQIRLYVDGCDAGTRSIPISDAPGMEQIISFDIPGELVASDHPRISICGDHIAFQYWFANPIEN